MFTLYKKRGLSEYINDTIGFFKAYGKHYFKNYFIINGGLLLILMVLVFFVFKVGFEAMFASFETQKNNPNYIYEYLSNNFVLFIGTFLLFFILVLVLSILNVAYPVLYLQLVEKNNGSNFSTAAIVSSFKNNFGRIIKFFLGGLFIIMPILSIVFVVTLLLCFVLIGIPLFILMIPAIISWVILSFHDYILEETGFFESLQNGFGLVKQQLWPIIGTTIITLIIIQVIQGILTMIPYAIGMACIFVNPNSSGLQSSANNQFSSFGILMTVVMALSILLNYFFNNFIIINQGIIFYSLKETNENTSSENLIDLIGAENE